MTILLGRQYSAVSYRWEFDLAERLIIKSSSSARASYVPISRSMQVMLKHFRKCHKQQYLWVDAICLNQEDEMEKAVQVGLMGEIYSQAKKVHIWLGSYNRALHPVPRSTRCPMDVAAARIVEAALHKGKHYLSRLPYPDGTNGQQLKDLMG